MPDDPTVIAAVTGGLLPRRANVSAGELLLSCLLWGDEGDATVLLVHGNGGHAHWWDALAPHLSDGTVWKVSTDTYDREVERYGGDAGIELAEQIHAADSDAVLEVLGLLDGDFGEAAPETRWKLCLYATDRLLARWELTSSRVKRLAAEQPAPLRERPALRLNEVRRQAGLPVSSEPLESTEAPRLLLEVPEDWDALCHADRGLALEWQGIVRRSLQAAFAQGYAAVDVVPGTAWGGPCYVLDRTGEAGAGAGTSTRRASPKAATRRKTTRSTSPRKAPRAARRRAARAGRGRR